MPFSEDHKRYIGATKVGPKGQIVIPKEVRDMFGIKAGDTLVILADTEKGIAIQSVESLVELTDAVFDGKASASPVGSSVRNGEIFIRHAKEVIKEEENGNGGDKS